MSFFIFHPKSPVLIILSTIVSLWQSELEELWIKVQLNQKLKLSAKMNKPDKLPATVVNLVVHEKKLILHVQSKNIQTFEDFTNHGSLNFCDKIFITML